MKTFNESLERFGMSTEEIIANEVPVGSNIKEHLQKAGHINNEKTEYVASTINSHLKELIRATCKVNKCSESDFLRVLLCNHFNIPLNGNR